MQRMVRARYSAQLGLVANDNGRHWEPKLDNEHKGLH